MRCARKRLRVEGEDASPWCAAHRLNCNQLIEGYHKDEKRAFDAGMVHYLNSYLVRPANAHLVHESTEESTKELKQILIDHYPTLLTDPTSHIGQLKTIATYLRRAVDERYNVLDRCFDWDLSTWSHRNSEAGHHCTEETENHVFRAELLRTILNAVKSLLTEIQHENRRKQADLDKMAELQKIKEDLRRLTLQQEEPEVESPESPTQSPAPLSREVKRSRTLDEMSVQDVGRVADETRTAHQREVKEKRLTLAEIMEPLQHRLFFPSDTRAAFGLVPASAFVRKQAALVTQVVDGVSMGEWHVSVAKSGMEGKRQSSSPQDPVLSLSLMMLAINAGEAELEMRARDSDDRFWFAVLLVNYWWQKRLEFGHGGHFSQTALRKELSLVVDLGAHRDAWFNLFFDWLRSEIDSAKTPSMAAGRRPNLLLRGFFSTLFKHETTAKWKKSQRTRLEKMARDVRDVVEPYKVYLRLRAQKFDWIDGLSGAENAPELQDMEFPVFLVSAVAFAAVEQAEPSVREAFQLMYVEATKAVL